MVFEIEVEFWVVGDVEMRRDDRGGGCDMI